MILVVMLSNHLSVVVSTACHDAIRGLSLPRSFCDYLSRCVSVNRSRCRSVDYLVRSEIIFDLFRNYFGRHNCIHSALIELAWSSHHLSGALAVALIILLVGVLVGTLDIRPVLGAVIISNCSPAVLRLWIPFLLQL